MADLITTRDVAEMYGVTLARVRALARLRGVRGRKVGNMWVWTRAQAEAMRPRPRAGRPPSPK